MTLTAPSLLTRLGLFVFNNFKILLIYFYLIIENSVDVAVLSETIKTFVQNSADQCVSFSGIVLHDCLRQEYLQLEDGTFRSILYVGILKTPGLSSWLHVAPVSDQCELQVIV